MAEDTAGQVSIPTRQRAEVNWNRAKELARVKDGAPVPFGRVVDGLASNELALVRSEPGQVTAEFLAAGGAYTFPMACRLFWASKQGDTSAPLRAAPSSENVEGRTRGS